LRGLIQYLVQNVPNVQEHFDNCICSSRWA